MQIYSALQQRNAFGLRLWLLSSMTGNSAETLARIAPRGQFEHGYDVLSDLAAGVSTLKEMHHFYPVLLFFRFPEAHYSLSFISSTLLDCVSLIESGLDEEKYGWVQESGAVSSLWEASMLLTDMIERTFLPAKSQSERSSGSETEAAEWSAEYLTALQRLRASGIATTGDPDRGVEKYVRLRKEWAGRIRPMVLAMLYRTDEVNPGLMCKSPGLQPERA